MIGPDMAVGAARVGDDRLDPLPCLQPGRAADAARLPDAKSLETAIDGVLLPRIPVGEGVDALPLVLGWLLTRPPT